MEKAVEINPLNPQANLFLAQFYEENNNFILALDHYKNYLEATRDITIYPKVEKLINKTKKF